MLHTSLSQALDGSLLLEGVYLIFFETEVLAVDLLVVEAGRPAKPLDPWRSLLGQLGGRADDDLTVHEIVDLEHMPPVLEMRELRHLVGKGHAARGHLFGLELRLSLKPRVVLEPLGQGRI